MSEYIVYTKDGCGFCTHVKNLLNSKKLTFIEHKIGVAISKDTIQQKVMEAGSSVIVRSVPQIFHGNNYIGGFSELRRYLST